MMLDITNSVGRRYYLCDFRFSWGELQD